jgi:hypothetical protein
VLPDGNIVAVYWRGTSNEMLLYKFTPAGAMILQTAFNPGGVPGFGASGRGVMYVAALDKIAISWVGPGVLLFDPATLLPASGVLGQISTQDPATIHVSNVNRFVCLGRQGSGAGNIALFEHDAALGAVTQKYIYGTAAVSTVVAWDRYCVDQFGAVYLLYIDTDATTRGVYIMRVSASAGGYTPIQAVFFDVVGDPLLAPGIINYRIQVKPDGDILVLWAGRVNETMYYQMQTIAADLSVTRSRVVCTLTRAGGAQTEPQIGGEFTVSADYKKLAISAPRVSPLIVPLDVPANNEISFVSATHGTVRVYAETMNRAATQRPDLLPARSVNPNSVIPAVFNPISKPPTMVDLTARYTWDALGRCTTFGPVAGFAVSETITVGAAMSIGANNWMWQTALTTAVGNVYLAGLAQLSGQAYAQARWFIAKYDSDMNLLWAKWLEGPYVTGTLPNDAEDNGPALAEGPADGVFVVTKGKSSINNTSLGASFRIYLLNSTGALVNTAAWQVGPNQYGFTAIQEDQPAAALYVPSQDRLYIAGRSHMRVVMRGLTLDQPYVADAGGVSQSGGQRIFWLPGKQRVVFAGTMDGQPYAAGSHVTEYSPDLATRYQYYGYNVFRASNVAMDQFGSVYLVNIPNIYAQNPEVRLTKLASSDAGYTPIWSRRFFVTPPPTAGITINDCAVEVLPDGRIVVSTATPESSGSSKAMRASFYTITPDGTKIIARTRLNWTGIYPFTTYSGFIDPVRETATFIAYPFTIGRTSLRLPSISVDVLLGSTAAGGNANKNMTGNTDYTEVLLTDDVLPSRTVIAALSREANPMAPWGEAAWSTSDLTATVSHVTKSTGPLMAPVL